MSESKTVTGKTEGNSGGGTFREDQSKHFMRFCTQSRVIVLFSGQHIGMHSSGGGGGGDGGCGVSSVEVTALVVAESGGDDESARRVIVDQSS